MKQSVDGKMGRDGLVKSHLCLCPIVPHGTLLARLVDVQRSTVCVNSILVTTDFAEYNSFAWQAGRQAAWVSKQ